MQWWIREYPTVKNNKNDNADKQDYWSYIKRQFKKNRRALYSMYIVIFMAIIALLADVLANEKPLYCSYQGHTYFPVFKEYGVDLGISRWPKELLNISWTDTKF